MAYENSASEQIADFFLDHLEVSAFTAAPQHSANTFQLS